MSDAIPGGVRISFAGDRRLAESAQGGMGGPPESGRPLRMEAGREC